MPSLLPFGKLRTGSATPRQGSSDFALLEHARQLLLRCEAHGCASVAGAGCAGATSRRLFQTPFYLPHPWGRTSCIHAVVLRSAASMPGIHSPPGERVSFSCVAKRKSPKRRPPHTRALRTVPVLQVREAAPGFADSPSMDWHRTGPHRVGHPSDNSCAASPRPRGPHQRASCAPKQRAKSKEQREKRKEKREKPKLAGIRFVLAAHDPQETGPLCSGNLTEGKPAGWAQGIAPSSMSVQGWTVSEPQSRVA
jgi:hypothetical protein